MILELKYDQNETLKYMHMLLIIIIIITNNNRRKF
jgi:hypothetical protein